MGHPTDLNGCAPAALALNGTPAAALSVLHVLPAGHLPEVVPALVEWVSVDVVNLHPLNGPPASDPGKYNHPVGMPRPVMNGKLMTSFAAIASQRAVVIAAVKRSSEWVVGILFPQVLYRRTHVRL